MYQPKKRKHKKEFRGKMPGLAWRGSELHYGEYGLQALDRKWITGRQIEAARKAVARYTKRKGRVWINIFPQKPVTKKNDETTRGMGKGDVSHYVAVVKPGRLLLEIAGVPEEIAKEALRLASHKFPIKTRVISK